MSDNTRKDIGAGNSTLSSIIYDGTTLQVLDQLLLPLETKYIQVNTAEDGHRVIKDMNVRGAPAIAIVGAIAIAVDAALNPENISKNCDYLVTSRPTAVNLSRAMAEMKSLNAKECKEYALRMLKEDIETNKKIGDYGAEWSRKVSGNDDDGSISVVTICNTGSLATAGYGTALGVIRSLHDQAKLSMVYPMETRPYNQGARLTAYELVHDKIPATLITDSMAASVLATKNVALAVVGADRVAANGDTANKIGTFQLAVLCRHFGVKFAVAAPTTSIDLQTSSGDKIVIEERPAHELTHVNGTQIAAPGVGVWNPAFDVTPFDLIDAIITERGVIEKVDGVFNLQEGSG